MTGVRRSRQSRDGAERVVADTSPGDGPDVGTVFDILSNRRRRHVLHYLKQVDGPVTMRGLSEQLTAWETGKDRSAIRPAERKRVYTALHQNHLPRMDRAGVLDYDSDRGTVVLTDEFDAYDIYLEVTARRDLHWGLYYVGLGTTLALLTAATAVGTWPFSLVPVLAWSGLFAAVVAASGVVHLLGDDRLRVGTSRFQRATADADLEAPPAEAGEPSEAEQS